MKWTCLIVLTAIVVAVFGDRIPLGTEVDPAESCSELQGHMLHLSSGEYWLQPEGADEPFKAYCDMDTFGGGWQMCYTTDDKVHVSTEISSTVPYPSVGYRSDCRHSSFNQVMYKTADDQVWFDFNGFGTIQPKMGSFKGKIEPEWTPSDCNMGPAFSAMGGANIRSRACNEARERRGTGAYDQMDVNTKCAAVQRYSMIVCDAEEGKGYFGGITVLGQPGYCVSSCESICDGVDMDWYRTNGGKGFEGTSFKQYGHKDLPTGLLSVGVRNGAKPAAWDAHVIPFGSTYPAQCHWYCGAYTAPPHGSVNPAGENVEWPNGVTISCDTGYYPAGPGTVAPKCTKEGTFELGATCEEIRCGTRIQDENGFFADPSVLTDMTPVGNTVALMCNYGYSLSGLAGMAVPKCLFNGVWENFDICIPRIQINSVPLALLEATTRTLQIDIVEEIPSWATSELTMTLTASGRGSTGGTSFTATEFVFRSGERYKSFDVTTGNRNGPLYLDWALTGPIAVNYTLPIQHHIAVQATMSTSNKPASLVPLQLYNAGGGFGINLQTHMDAGPNVIVTATLSGYPAIGSSVNTAVTFTSGDVLGPKYFTTTVGNTYCGLLFWTYSLSGSYAPYYTPPPQDSVPVKCTFVVTMPTYQDVNTVDATIPITLQLPLPPGTTLQVGISHSGVPSALATVTTTVSWTGIACCVNTDKMFSIGAGNQNGPLTLAYALATQTPEGGISSMSDYYNVQADQVIGFRCDVYRNSLPASTFYQQTSPNIQLSLEIAVTAGEALTVTITHSGHGGATSSNSGPVTFNNGHALTPQTFTQTAGTSCGPDVLTYSFTGSYANYYKVPATSTIKNICNGPASGITVSTVPASTLYNTQTTDITLTLQGDVLNGNTAKVLVSMTLTDGSASVTNGASGGANNIDFVNADGVTPKTFRVTPASRCGTLTLSFASNGGSWDQYYTYPSDVTLEVICTGTSTAGTYTVSSSPTITVSAQAPVPTGFAYTVTLAITGGEAATGSTITTTNPLVWTGGDGDTTKTFTLALGAVCGPLTLTYASSGTFFAGGWVTNPTSPFVVTSQCSIDITSVPTQLNAGGATDSITITLGGVLPTAGNALTITGQQSANVGTYDSWPGNPAAVTTTWANGDGLSKTQTMTSANFCGPVTQAFLKSGNWAAYYYFNTATSFAVKLMCTVAISGAPANMAMKATTGAITATTQYAVPTAGSLSVDITASGDSAGVVKFNGGSVFRLDGTNSLTRSKTITGNVATTTFDVRSTGYAGVITLGYALSGNWATYFLAAPGDSTITVDKQQVTHNGAGNPGINGNNANDFDVTITLPNGNTPNFCDTNDADFLVTVTQPGNHMTVDNQNPTKTISFNPGDATKVFTVGRDNVDEGTAGTGTYSFSITSICWIAPVDFTVADNPA